MKGLNVVRAEARSELAEGVAQYHAPVQVDVRAIRAKTRLSQTLFVCRFGFSPGAVRDWEQGRKQPEAAARALLTVIDREPEALERALTAS